MATRRNSRKVFSVFLILLTGTVADALNVVTLNSTSVTWLDAVTSCEFYGQSLSRVKSCSELEVLGDVSDDIWVGQYYKDSNTWKTLSKEQPVPEMSAQKCFFLSTVTGITEDRCDKDRKYLCSGVSGMYMSQIESDWLTAATQCDGMGFYMTDQQSIVDSAFRHEEDVWIGRYKEWSYIKGEVTEPDRCLSCYKDGGVWKRHNDICTASKSFVCEKVIQTTTFMESYSTPSLTTDEVVTVTEAGGDIETTVSKQSEGTIDYTGTTSSTRSMETTGTSAPITSLGPGVSGGQGSVTVEPQVVDVTNYIIGLALEGGVILLLVIGLCLYKSYVSGYKRGTESFRDKI